MATVYDTQAMRRHLAHMAKADVHIAGQRLARQARADLAAHRAEGAAQIVVETHDLDTIVSLQDYAPTHGSANAMSIEFGRSAYVRLSDGVRVGPMKGLYILTKLL